MQKPNPSKVFLICPVRNVSEEVKAKILAYVHELESRGREVYYPDRDNPHQNTDKIGVLICGFNRRKMVGADEIHVWYDKSSDGSKFDLGMFFVISTLPYIPRSQESARYRQITIVNIEDVRPTPHKSFENILLYWSKEQKLDPYFWNRIIE